MPDEYGALAVDFYEVHDEQANLDNPRDQLARDVTVVTCAAQNTVAASCQLVAKDRPPRTMPRPVGSKVPVSGENGGTRLIAPMPGVITICEKNVEEQVQKGEVILILEAMKMENLITAPVTGKVISILCKEGERVGKGAVLAVIG